MQWMLSHHVTKRETDGGQKARYYATTLSDKNDLWSVYGAQVQWNSLPAPFSPVQEVVLHLHPECTRSQQFLTLTKANKVTCMPRWHIELAIGFAVLMLHRSRSSLPLKMVVYSIHCPFYVWLREALHKVYRKDFFFLWGGGAILLMIN